MTPQETAIIREFAPTCKDETRAGCCCPACCFLCRKELLDERREDEQRVGDETL